MEIGAKKKAGKAGKKAAIKNKQPRKIDTTLFSGSVAAFKNLDALAYQRLVRGK